MSPAHDLFNDLASHGVRIWLDAGQIRYKAVKGTMTQERLSAIRQHKAELVGLLAINDDRPQGSESKQFDLPSLLLVRVTQAIASRPLIALTYEMDGKHATCVDPVFASLDDAVADLRGQHGGRVGRIWCKGEEVML